MLRSRASGALAAARSHCQTLIFLLLLVCIAVPAVIAPLSYPNFYEDESWSFIAVFEFLRGNFLSWGSFDEGQAVFVTVYGLPLAFAALSPFGPEVTIRLFAFVCGAVALTALFVCGRRLAANAAWVAPAILIATPVMLEATRFGRFDVEALMFASISLACAAYKKPAVAGVFSGFAVSTHPIYLWVAAPCLVLAHRDGIRSVWLYLGGAVIGAVPQVVWTLSHLDGNREIWDRYARSNTDSPHGLVHALRHASDRYRLYFDALDRWQVLFHVAAYIVLPLVAIVVTRRNRLLVLSLVLVPVLVTGALISLQNPYYAHFVALPLALAAGIAVSNLPAGARGILMAGVAAAVLLVTLNHVQRAEEASDFSTPREAVQWLTNELPPDAVVWAPNLYAGLLDTRPDVRFFNYKSLSLRPGWRLPSCADLDDRLRQIMQDDARSHPPRREADAVYFVMYLPFAAYLSQTYPSATQADVDCMLAAGELRKSGLCATRYQPAPWRNPRTDMCHEVVIARHPLH